MVQLLAFSLQDQVEKYGAYIGIAAFFGLAVLTILYFSQARELRRLRDWAGRAPERAQEMEARVVAQAEAARRVQAQPQASPARAPVAAATAAAGGAAAQPAEGQPATRVVEGDEAGEPAAAQAGNGTTSAAGKAGEGGKPPGGADGDEAEGEQAAAAEGEQAAAGEQPAPEDAQRAAAEGEGGDRPGEDAARETEDGEAPEGARPAAGEAAKPAAAAPASPPGEQAKQPAEAQPAKPAPANPRGSEQPATGEIPVAPVPRATPLPRRAPAPAAPLRQPSRSTAVPRRSAPRPTPATASAGASRGSVATLIGVGVGVIVLAVGALFAFGVIGGDDNPAPRPNTTTEPTAEESPEATALTPAATKVAVLNGTTFAGLASDSADEIRAAGYSGEVTTGNNTDQQRSDSEVLYGTRRGARTHATAIARRLDIATLGRLDADTRNLSENADVVVILGQDKAP
jgi:hypothetical protein